MDVPSPKDQFPLEELMVGIDFKDIIKILANKFAVDQSEDQALWI